MCTGVGLHNGQNVRMVLKPAPVSTGIVFIRTDVKDRDNHIPMRVDAVCGVKNCTTLHNAAGVSVSTIEHFTAALAALGIDNLRVELDNAELPALDGSSEPFFNLIKQVGIESQAAPRRYVKVLKTLHIVHGGSEASIMPADRLSLDVTIDFDDAAIGRQNIYITPDERSFRDSLAGARTFARAHELQALKQAGLSQGGSLANAILVDGDKIVNPEGLRFSDEFVRHKALDLLGDIYLGGPIIGHIKTVRAGHKINHALLLALYSDPMAWEFVTLMDSQEPTMLDSVSA